MHIRIIDTIDHVAAEQWNRLHDQRNPFLKHEFLAALEHQQCVGGNTGWLPRIVIAEQDGRLTGAIPMYLKFHSMGEFVFDWAWASAYSRAGLKYYPKLVIAIPFTPVTGPRILVSESSQHDRVADLMIDHAVEFARTTNISSMHWLFPDSGDAQRLEQHGLMQRSDCQFHWRNNDYNSFDDFLTQLSSHKRKKLKRERRYVKEQDIQCRILTGSEISTADMDNFYDFYLATFHKKGHSAPLTAGFFQDLRQTLPENIVLILAYHQDKCIAGAFFMRGPDTLYGRYWGCIKEFHSLHFELCYYCAIDYSIEHGLKFFEAGAQGEHKLVRGFYPTQTRSFHWISHPEFRRAIETYLTHETQDVEYYMQLTEKHLPYKTGTQ